MNADDATHGVNPDQRWGVRSQEQAWRREINTLESLGKKHFLEFCMSLFDLTFTGLAEGVNQKKGPKYENGSACLK